MAVTPDVNPEGAGDSPPQYLPSQYLGAHWAWKEFVFRPEVNTTHLKMTIKSKRALEEIRLAAGLPEVDQHRLVYAAHKAADAPDVSQEVLLEIEAELDKQLTRAKNFKSGASKKVQRYDEDYKETKALLAHLVDKKAEARKNYLQKKTGAFANKFQETDDDIGRPDDMDFTIHLLEMEIDAVTKELDYIKAVLGDAADDDVPQDENDEDPGEGNAGPEGGDIQEVDISPESGQAHLEEDVEEEDIADPAVVGEVPPDE
jgi:hypothetical protein